LGGATFDLHCKAYKLTPTPEFRFDQVRRWRFDYAWPEIMLAVEIEGGTWNIGRHQRPEGFIKDIEKYNAAVLAGWKVLRYTTDQVMLGIAIQQVREFVARLVMTP
jgi:hypothetical protein